ncbi:phosphoribosyl-ATP diphosphatase [Clostridium sp. YIM B02505]|uniref:Phosphoribosyl-ATP pyrophosphatase n=1 Tax=Clostridium yunnanense TaxID=2800325 RepID=A0ABS1ELU5_9CLOT|nr:phosphoribosyl-ATP diphosphatase [Clostridium yunnanense]MBK1810339.1 phosphoribosyl-ATP diphosphatase [Clostridium yunnanense]
MEDELKQLYEVIKFRKENPMEGSYTNYLFSKGRDKILKKVGEECTEVIIEGKNGSKENGISEISDLLYHTLVLMADMEIEVDEVYQELNKRSQKIGNLKRERTDIEIL